jgi:hypothetical protein
VAVHDRDQNPGQLMIFVSQQCGLVHTLQGLASRQKTGGPGVNNRRSRDHSARRWLAAPSFPQMLTCFTSLPVPGAEKLGFGKGGGKSCGEKSKTHTISRVPRTEFSRSNAY